MYIFIVYLQSCEVIVVFALLLISAVHGELVSKLGNDYTLENSGSNKPGSCPSVK